MIFIYLTFDETTDCGTNLLDIAHVEPYLN